MEANYVHKDSTTLIQDKLVKNELNQIELQYNALKQQKFNELLKENQELKQKYVNAVADYETTMAEKEQLNSLVNSCQEEIRQLKKQLTTYQILHRDCNIDNLKNISKIEEKETQQKEFIEYLENEIYSIEPKGTGINYNCEYDSEEDYISAMKEQSKLNTLKEILSKFKEIIGDDE